MDSYPVHLHGAHFEQTATDGGKTPLSARLPETTVNVPVGATRDIEWVADAPGALDCSAEILGIVDVRCPLRARRE